MTDSYTGTYAQMTRIETFDNDTYLKEKPEVLGVSMDGSVYGVTDRMVGFIPAYFRDTQADDLTLGMSGNEIIELQAKGARLYGLHSARVSVPMPAGVKWVRTCLTDINLRPALLMIRENGGIERHVLERQVEKKVISPQTYQGVLDKVQCELDKVNKFGIPHPKIDHAKFLWLPSRDIVILTGAYNYGMNSRTSKKR